VGLGAAEPQHVDVLAGHRADDVGAGDEDPAVGAEDHDVGERRAVGRAAGRRAEHDRDLRDLARGLRHGVEDPAHGVQRQDALGEPGAARVPEADDRHAVGHGEVVGVDDHPATDVAHRATHDGRVGAEGHDPGTVDVPDRREHAGVVVRGDQLHGALVEERPQPVDRVARVLVAGELGRLRLTRLGRHGRVGPSGVPTTLSTEERSGGVENFVGWLIRRSRTRRRRWLRRTRRSC
jgi:hypothetical protein